MTPGCFYAANISVHFRLYLLQNRPALDAGTSRAGEYRHHPDL